MAQGEILPRGLETRDSGLQGRGILVLASLREGRLWLLLGPLLSPAGVAPALLGSGCGIAL